MNDFNDIRSKWVQRNIPDIPKDGYKEIIKSSAYIKRKQLTGQLILMLTVIILGYFFFYISAFKNTRLTVGILLMIGTLLFRIGIEFFSQTKLEQLTPTLQVQEFNQQVMAYHQSRLFIHYVLTPLSFIGYVIGFIITLPIFKLHVSTGLYNYIVISAVPIFIFLIVLISAQVKKELRMINGMKKDIDNES